MNFQLSGDQIAFQESVIKFLQQEYDFDSRQKTVASKAPYSHSMWKDCAELGWLSLFFKEEYDGFGGTPIDTTVLFEQLGRHLVVEPFLQAGLQSACVLQACEHPQKETMIRDLMAGDLHLSLAHLEPYQRDFDATLSTQALECDNGFTLSGTKSLVFNAACSSGLLVTANLKGERAIFLLPVDSKGVSVRSYETVDGREASDVTLETVSLAADQLLLSGSLAEAVLAKLLDNTLVAQIAEMLGGMQVLLDATVEYTRDRRQFGASLSQFQVLQHKMVEMFMAIELLRSILFAAAIKLRDGADDARRYVAAAKVKADKAARLTAQFAVQLHGGIGTTDELKIGHYLKHFEVMIAQFGSTQSHLQRFCELN